MQCTILIAQLLITFKTEMNRFLQIKGIEGCGGGAVKNKCAVEDRS